MANGEGTVVALKWGSHQRPPYSCKNSRPDRWSPTGHSECASPWGRSRAENATGRVDSRK